MSNISTDKILQVTRKGGHKMQRPDGATYWLASRMIRKDGSLSPKGLEAQANAMTKEEYVQTKKAEREELLPLYAPAFERETEKAACYNVLVLCVHTAQNKQRQIWFPKSQISENNSIPRWLYQCKVEELLKDVSERYSYRRSALVVEGLLDETKN